MKRTKYSKHSKVVRQYADGGKVEYDDYAEKEDESWVDKAKKKVKEFRNFIPGVPETEKIKRKQQRYLDET